MAPVSVAAKVGMIPATGLLFLFRRRIETDASDEPSAMADAEPDTLELSATGTKSTKLTFAEREASAAGLLTLIVFCSSSVDFRVAIETPRLSEVLPGESEF